MLLGYVGYPQTVINSGAGKDHQYHSKMYILLTCGEYFPRGGSTHDIAGHNTLQWQWMLRFLIVLYIAVKIKSPALNEDKRKSGRLENSICFSRWSYWLVMFAVLFAPKILPLMTWWCRQEIEVTSFERIDF